MEFSSRRLQWMPMQNDHPLAGAARPFLDAPREIDFFTGVQFEVESADFPKRRRFAKNERTRRQAQRSAQKIPRLREHTTPEMSLIELNCASACQTAVSLDLCGDISKKPRARMRVRIDKHQPGTRSGPRSRIAGSGDLVDGLKNDLRPGVGGQSGGAIRGIVIADDQFGFPPPFGEGDTRPLYGAERLPNEFLLIKCRHDDGDFHGRYLWDPGPGTQLLSGRKIVSTTPPAFATKSTKFQEPCTLQRTMEKRAPSPRISVGFCDEQTLEDKTFYGDRSC